MLSENAPLARFEVVPLQLQKLETALTEPRYMVTLLGQGKRFMIAPKLADVIVQLQQKKSPEEVAQNLSLLWEQQVPPEALCQIIEHQLLKQGMVYPAGEAPSISLSLARSKTRKPQPLLERLLKGQFRWRLIPRNLVSKLCSPLTVLYEPLSIVPAALLMIATRWSLYSGVDRHFVRQVMIEFTPNEYLLSLLLLFIVVLIHEFGHASAQIRFGLPAGAIGFQLYHYIPAFFANVDASWKLKPSQRMVVDISGIYFQCIASSLLFLIYLKTQFIPVLTTVVASDILSLVALNPFLRFDGYWLVADALAVPNLHSQSKKLWAQYRRRLLERTTIAADIPLLSRGRAFAVALYGLVRNCFWVFLLAFLLWRARRVLASVWATISHLSLQELEGLRTGNLSLIIASLFRLVLFTLMVLAITTILAGLLVNFGNLCWSGIGKLWPRKAKAVLSDVHQAS
jgi:putative peptide zinc metalloprotease protein